MNPSEAPHSLDRNFQATAWNWFRQCRGCGGTIELGAKFHEARERNAHRRLPEYRWKPARLCAACVMRMLLAPLEEDESV